MVYVNVNNFSEVIRYVEWNLWPHVHKTHFLISKWEIKIYKDPKVTSCEPSRRHRITQNNSHYAIQGHLTSPCAVSELKPTCPRKTKNSWILWRGRTMHQLLPLQTTASQNYSLREQPHQFQLPERSGRLSDSNFVNRMLYKDILTFCLLITPRFT